MANADISADLSAADQAAIKDSLIAQLVNQHGLDLGDATKAAMSALNAPDQAAQGVAGIVESVAQGHAPGLDTFIPLIGLGLAASGVGAPAAAVVTAGLELATVVLQGLGLFGGGDEKCDWKVGDLCFHGTRAAGMTDPRWVTWEKWYANAVNAVKGVGFQADRDWSKWDPKADHDPNAWYRQIVGDPVRSLANPIWTAFKNDYSRVRADEEALKHPNDPNWAGTVAMASPEVRGIHAAFVHAWYRDAERRINGYRGVDPANLLQQVVKAWNRGHSAASTDKITWKDNGRRYDSAVGDVIDGNFRETGTVATRGQEIAVNGGPVTIQRRVVLLPSHVAALAQQTRHAPKRVIPLGGGHAILHPSVPPVTAKASHLGWILGAVGSVGGAIVGGPVGAAVGGSAGFGIGAFFDKSSPNPPKAGKK